MNNELTTQETQVIAQKRNAWANMGEVVHTTELQLQAFQQQALERFSLPTKIEDVPDAEALLKVLKSSKATLEDKRKEVTSKFDAVSQRLMQPEKALLEPIAELSKAIISVKKIEEDRLRKLKEKADEIVRYKQFIINSSNDAKAAAESSISRIISQAYEYALGDGNIDIDGLPEYISRCKNKYPVIKFVMELPKCNSILTEEERDDIIRELYTYDSAYYKQKFDTLLDEKFSDYAVALANKEQAIALSKKQEEEEKKRIEEEKKNKELSASLQSMAALDVQITTDTKALKKSYEVDMPETPETAILLMAAFVGNKNLVLQKLKVNKWFAFSIGQIANALGKCKNDDENFAPQGIIFKQIDKL